LHFLQLPNPIDGYKHLSEKFYHLCSPAPELTILIHPRPQLLNVNSFQGLPAGLSFVPYRQSQIAMQLTSLTPAPGFSAFPFSQIETSTKDPLDLPKTVHHPAKLFPLLPQLLP